MAIPADAPVRLFDRYALHGEIASGGMASVHFGRLIGPGGFSRTVAIKRMHQAFARDPLFVEMFLAEARIAARVRHPNVVPTLDVVAHDGEAFLIMEFVLGESLAGLLRALHDRHEQVPVAIASAILIGALQGLHAAHEVRGDDGQLLGLVHRDVSPQNIIVGVDGAPRVLDFGIAKASCAASDATQQGILKGKAGYLAPEQIRGGPIDRRVDVFAASVVLWEVLTGERLFVGKSPEHNLLLVLEQEIPPPGSRRPELPSTLDRLVLRGLSRDPDARFQTALDMAHALEQAAAPASSTTLGQWVREVAGAAVALRADQLARMDASRTLDASYDEPHSKSESSSSAPAAELPTAVHGLARHAAPAPSRTRWIAWSAAAILSTAAVAGWVTLRSRAPAAACTLPPLQHLASGPAAHHTCALAGDRSIWCWGDNDKAQLGAGHAGAVHGASQARLQAAPLALGVGNVHSCAVLDDAHVACWGKGLVPKPTRVIGLEDAIAIAPGGMHTCALRRDAAIDCWGDNDAGQLGSTARDAALAVSVQGLSSVRAVASGTSHACAVTHKGAVYCWGSNNAFGQLGTGTTDHDPHPSPVAIEGLPPAIGVSAGDKTSFAWTAEGKAFGWGFTIKRPLLVPLDDILEVDAGGRQNCAVRRDHSVWCWGFNDAGQLGQASADDAPEPVKVAGLPPVREVAVGDRHACALSDVGEVWCWGSNQQGELGAGSPDQAAHPIPQRVRATGCR